MLSVPTGAGLIVAATFTPMTEARMTTLAFGFAVWANPPNRRYFADQNQHKARIGSKAKRHAGKNRLVIRALMTIDRTAPQDIDQPATFSGYDKICRAIAI